MVEMIPNAETLRKIQVEHGVTGSFKDRPLADWLQKHNPKEDEYEKVRSGEKWDDDFLCLRVNNQATLRILGKDCTNAKASLFWD